jgi:hypothetical protein
MTKLTTEELIENVSSIDIGTLIIEETKPENKKHKKCPHDKRKSTL